MHNVMELTQDEYQIVELDPVHAPLWRQLIERQSSSVFHTPMWLSAIADTYGMAIRAQVLCDRQQPLAGVAYGRIDDPFGERLVSLPYSDFGDPLLSLTSPQLAAAQWQKLSDRLIDLDVPIKMRVLHHTAPLQDSRWQQSNRARWHGTSLTADKKQLWRQLDSSARRAIRKARAQGVSVRHSTELADIRTFFEMHLALRKNKYRLLAQPYRFFENIWQKLIEPGHGSILVAEHEGQPIGATLLLHWQNTLTYKFNTSAASALSLRPNDLMIWHALCWGCDNGMTRFDFGLSDWDQTGLVRYKRKFADEEKTIHFLTHTPIDWQPTVAQPMRGVLSQLTDLLTDPDTPDHVTEEAGDLLYRFFI